MRGRGTLAYAAFDLLWLNGRDLRGLPLAQRKKRLESLIPAAVGALNRAPCFEKEGRELFEAACGLDLEGIVAKRTLTGRRPPGTRSKTLPIRRRREGGSCLNDSCRQTGNFT
jgi:bifunctional non-homologous end joining protein LigD